MPFAGDMITALALPAEVQAYGNGTNTITAITWAVLPTASATAIITNPSSQYNLKVLVLYACQLRANGQDIIASIAASGGVTVSPGSGNGGAIGSGELPFLGNQSNNNTYSASSFVTFGIPPAASPVTFTWYAQSGGAGGTQMVNFPTTRVIPLYYY